MTSRPRLLAAPALLVVAACVVLAVALGDPAHPVLGALLVAAALLVVVAAGLALWSVQSLATDLDGSQERAASQGALLDEVFAAETASVLVVTGADGVITRFNPGAEAVVAACPWAAATTARRSRCSSRARRSRSRPRTWRRGCGADRQAADR